MDKNGLYKSTLFLLFLVGFLDVAGNILHLHWSIWWYDVFLHFISGGLVGIIFIIFGIWFSSITNTKKSKIIFLSFLFVFLVGFLWEVFELYIGATSFYQGEEYILDTISDFLADLSGGLLGTIYCFKFFPKNNDKIL